MYVVIVFFNKERTDYAVKGPFRTIGEALAGERSIWDNYAPDAIHAVETTRVFTP